MATVIGREKEINKLEKIYNSERAEFVAVYGRRRVGKTFLIKHALRNRITFQHTGVSPIEKISERNQLRTQLESFYYSLLNHGMEGIQIPKTWMEAFYLLEQLLIRSDKGQRQVIFIDELPWMDTPRSGFIPAFESFWNGWCSGRDNIMLIVCGSATAWILSNLARSKGGLYGRLTHEIKVSPFKLKECEAYFKHENIMLSRYDIVQAHMVFGGIPYYLGYFQKGLSLEQNIDNILFGNKPQLRDEFNRLFRAIFTNANDCQKIIRLLATRHSGFTREEISQATGIQSGGGLSDTLNSLAESDFIIKYTPFGASKRSEYYKLIDNFCLFWLKHVEPSIGSSSFMTDNSTSSILRYWRGVAFEEVCQQHTDEIRNALGISGIKCSVSAWSMHSDGDSPGVQIDLIIDRDDNIVNLCEMKFYASEYPISKDEEQKLRRRIETLNKHISPKKITHLTFVTTYGISPGKYNGIVQKSITMDQLFE